MNRLYRRENVDECLYKSQCDTHIHSFEIVFVVFCCAPHGSNLFSLSDHPLIKTNLAK